MRKLSEYINILDNELAIHFYSEFVLGESLKYSSFVINEKNGSYIGQKELIIDLAKEVYQVIHNHEPQDVFIYNKEDLTKYSNIFFEQLKIQLNQTETSYKAGLSRYYSESQTFNKVVIYVNINECQTYNNIVSILMHELLHAYENYQRQLSNIDPSLKQLTGMSSRYAKTLLNRGINTTKDTCKEIVNNLSSWEKNAYVSELSTELEKQKFDINKYNKTGDAYKEALAIFKNSDTWIRYCSLWEYLKKLKTDYFGEQDDFAEEYNELNGTTLTFNKIYKKLDAAFLSLFKRIETIIPKIFYDYYQEELTKKALNEGSMIRNNMTMAEFVKWDNSYKCLESVRPANGQDWKVYSNNCLSSVFTSWAKNWKRYPKVGQGWYAFGTLFKIIDIVDNKVYVKEEK